MSLIFSQCLRSSGGNSLGLSRIFIGRAKTLQLVGPPRIACVIQFAMFLLGVLHLAPAEASADGYKISVVGLPEPERHATSFSEALSVVRTIRQETPAAEVVVELPGDTIRLTEPLRLTTREAGTGTGRLTLVGNRNGKTVLSGAMPVDLANPTAERPLLGLGQTPDASIKVVDLQKLGLKSRASLVRRGPYSGNKVSRFELFQGDHRLTPARWPKEGYSNDLTVVGGEKGSMNVTFPQSVARRWANEPAPWLGGFWAYDWAFEALAAIGKNSDGTFRTDAMMAPFPPLPHPRAYAYNLLSELSDPGEFVLDPARQLVWVIPFNQADPVEVAVGTELLDLNGVKNVRVERIAVEKTLGVAVSIRNSTDVVLSDCYVGHSGGGGVSIEGGQNVHIERCVINDISDAAVALSGGDRKTLTRADHLVLDSIICNFGLDAHDYAPAVDLQGVGSSVSGNLITEASHSGILVGGNEHLIAGNEISRVVREGGDAGAIYMGRDWTQRGNIIKENFIHDIGDATPGSTSMGIYLDDQFSGTSVSGNIFLRVALPILIGGGRDNEVQDNVFAVFHRGAVLVDNRGESWQREMDKDGGALRKRLDDMPYQNDLWSTRYPRLKNILADRLGSPVGNTARNNIAIGGRFLETQIDPRDIPSEGSLTISITEEQSKQLATAKSASSLATLIDSTSQRAKFHPTLTDRRNLLDSLLYASKVSYLKNESK
jgi:hypothetical protein